MRFDKYLVENNYFESRTKSAREIEKGNVLIDNNVISKCSFNVDEKIVHNITINNDIRFVSIGGNKLYKALLDFDFSVNNFICADIGASTGGFTDCLLYCGAKHVFSVDLNDSLLHQTLKDNKKVTPLVKNAKLLKKNDFSSNIDLLVADLSFISIESVLKIFANLIDDNKYMIILVKPQFELGKKISIKNGIIKDKKLQFDALNKIYNYSLGINLTPENITTAPIEKDKNVEFLLLLKKNGKKLFDINNLKY